MPIDAERVIARLKDADAAMRDWKDKAYRLRRVVAGDQDALFTRASGKNRDQGVRSARMFQDARPDILIQEFSEGTDNEILKSLMVLVEQTIYTFPKIEIQGVSSKVQAVNNHYLKKTLDDCNAVDHGKIALLDYLMGGTGDLYTPTEDGVPIVRWADSLDLKWDQTARLACDVQWKSLTVCRPLFAWLSKFKSQRHMFELAFNGKIEDNMLDVPFEVEFYYDTMGERGNYAVLLKMGDTSYSPDLIYSGPNPHYFDYDGERVPYLPFRSLFYMTLPSVRTPVGAAEQALPDQIGAWRSADSIKRATDKGSPFYEYTADAFASEEAEEEWKKGGDAKVKQLGAIKQQAAMPMDPKVAEQLMMHTQGIQTQLGANNYSLGAPVAGVKYAREVNAMQSAGSLRAGTISKANARVWAGLCRNVLCAGAHFDKRNFSCRVEGRLMKFGKAEPIGPVSAFLRPDAEVVIAEDSMRFMPQAQRIEQAKLGVDVAMQGGQIFPKAVVYAYRKFWDAMGAENVDELVEMAPPPQAPPQQPGVDPNAVAAAAPGVNVALPKAGISGGQMPAGNQ